MRLFVDYQELVKTIKLRYIMKLFGCLGLILIIPLFVICAVLFNAWYLQVIYNIGLTPILSQFEIFLPQLGYWVFALMWVVYTGLHTLFKYDAFKTLNNEKENKTYNWNNLDERLAGIVKVLGPIISNIITKLLYLLLIYCTYCICF